MKEGKNPLLKLCYLQFVAFDVLFFELLVLFEVFFEVVFEVVLVVLLVVLLVALFEVLLFVLFDSDIILYLPFENSICSFVKIIHREKDIF